MSSRHPEAVLSNIKSWVDSNDETKKVTWLYGPAGAGKSAIAQTTAEDCHKDGALAAAFFFSRLAGRNKKDGLVATIAYQLCVSIPAAREHIIKNIERNPNVFKSNLKTQLQSLVIDPINLLYHTEGGSMSPWLIVIDGLDECELKKGQTEIIEAFVHALSMEHGSRLRVLLVSRPDLEIRQTFNSDNISRLCIRLALDDTFDPDKDIELYLRENFQTIKRLHILGSTLPESWPSDEDIYQIVKKSSGQFIYASTVVHFISDPKRNPRKRLNTILNVHPENGEEPFAQLDALYLNILSMCEDYGNVAAIFEAIMFLNKGYVPVSGNEILKPQYLNAFLSLEDDVLLYLASLHSIVDVTNLENTRIKFHHASFHDFLVDPYRSREFYINEHKAHTRFFFRCFDFLESNVSSGLPYIVYAYCLGCCFCHYEYSNWDDSILKFIGEKKILKPDNSQMKAIFQTFYAQPYTKHTNYTSMLGNLIESMPYTENDIDINARNMISEEAINHLKQYRQWQDDLMLLYVGDVYFYDTEEFEDQPMVAFPSEIEYLHKDIITALEKGNNSILNHDIMYNDDVNFWFRNLMETTGYTNQIPEDIRAKSMASVLRMIASRLARCNTSTLTVEYINHVDHAFYIFENMDMPCGMALDETVIRFILRRLEFFENYSGKKLGTSIKAVLRKQSKHDDMAEDSKSTDQNEALQLQDTGLPGDPVHSDLETVIQPAIEPESSVSQAEYDNSGKRPRDVVTEGSQESKKRARFTED